MENLVLKKDDQDCKSQYEEEESEAQLKYKSELKTKIKSEPIVNVESDMKNFIKEEITVEYPKIEIDNPNQYQFIREDELLCEMKTVIKTEEVIDSTENGEGMEFKQEKEDMEGDSFQDANSLKILLDENCQQTFQRENYGAGVYGQQQLPKMAFVLQENAQQFLHGENTGGIVHESNIEQPLRDLDHQQILQHEKRQRLINDTNHPGVQWLINDTNHPGVLGCGNSQLGSLQDSNSRTKQMIQTNKRKGNAILSNICKKYKIEEYCVMCQEFGHVMSNDCITCFNCGIRGHVRQDCPSSRQVFIRPKIDTKIISQLVNHDNIGEGRYDYPNHSKCPKLTNLTKGEGTEMDRECTAVSSSVPATKWINNNVADDYNDNVSAKPCIQVEGSEKEIINSKIHGKEIEVKKVDEKADAYEYLESVKDDRKVSDDMADAYKMSDDMADACKTNCQICHKVFPLYTMRYHTVKEHNLQITQYKDIYGNFMKDKSMIINPVYHKCHICDKIILLDNDRLGGHIKGAHNMKEKDYKALFMTNRLNGKRKAR